QGLHRRSSPQPAKRPAESNSAGLFAIGRRAPEARSDVEVRDVQRVFLDERSARFDLVTHQDGEDVLGLHHVFDADLEERSRLWIHGRLPELVRVHLPEALVAADLNPFSTALVDPLPELIDIADLSDLIGLLTVLVESDGKEWRLADRLEALLDRLQLADLSTVE